MKKMIATIERWWNNHQLHGEIEQAKADLKAQRERADEQHTTIGARMAKLVDEAVTTVGGEDKNVP